MTILNQSLENDDGERAVFHYMGLSVLSGEKDNDGADREGAEHETLLNENFHFLLNALQREGRKC